MSELVESGALPQPTPFYHQVGGCLLLLMMMIRRPQGSASQGVVTVGANRRLVAAAPVVVVLLLGSGHLGQRAGHGRRLQAGRSGGGREAGRRAAERLGWPPPYGRPHGPGWLMKACCMPVRAVVVGGCQSYGFPVVKLLVVGPPCAGKTRLAKRIAQR